jgi:hypothetical protein
MYKMITRPLVLSFILLGSSCLHARSYGATIYINRQYKRPAANARLIDNDGNKGLTKHSCLSKLMKSILPPHLERIVFKKFVYHPDKFKYLRWFYNNQPANYSFEGTIDISFSEGTIDYNLIKGSLLAVMREEYEGNELLGYHCRIKSLGLGEKRDAFNQPSGVEQEGYTRVMLSSEDRNDVIFEYRLLRPYGSGHIDCAHD